MKIKCFLIFCFTSSFVFASSDPAEAIRSQKTAISDTADIFADQNDVLDKTINLDKKIALELRRSIFYHKQRNELIVNEWRIQGEKEY